MKLFETVSLLSKQFRKSRKPKGFRFFFIQFVQGAVFGAFFMQRMCNLGKRAKDTVPYWPVDLDDSWSTSSKGHRPVCCLIISYVV